MRERPILFNAAMVRAILDGRKTQTRRIVKLPPAPNHLGEWEAGTISADPAANSTGLTIPLQGCIWHTRTGKSLMCPHGQPGDRLWVRETCSIESAVEGDNPLPFDDGRPVWRRPDDDVEGFLPAWRQPHYRATDPAPDLTCEKERCRQCREHDMGPHWIPSIHMPRWACRLVLEITAVHVERLQAISEEDAAAGGADPITAKVPTHRDAFRYVWEDTGGDWASNPWVWVIGFKRVQVGHG